MGNKLLPLGIESYEKACEYCYYVDKTGLLETIASYPSGTCLLFTRPRRFGKTLMLSMLQSFFEESSQDKSVYFEDKQIWKNQDVVKQHFQKYPLIHINLKNVIGENFPSLIDKLKETMRKEYARHEGVLPSLDDEEKRFYSSILNKTETQSDLSSSLARLTDFLSKASQKKIVLLIDEYDSPVHYAYDYGFYEPAILFFKRFFGESLKTNPNIQLAVLTGILQIAKESLFSGVNNLVTNTILSKNIDEGFGFTEEETKDILKYYDLEDRYEDVSSWYGGYHFGDKTIFNPLSILSFIQNGGNFAPYWNNTGESRTLASLLVPDSLNSIFPLLNDQEMVTEIDLAISYKDLNGSSSSLVSYLLASGYFSIDKDYGDGFYSLKLPNKEIKYAFQKEIRSRYIDKNQLPVVFQMRQAFEKGDTNKIENLLQEYLLSTLSYFEMNKEKNYQILISTMLSVIFDTGVVKNEVNAGTGRADIFVTPRKNKELAFVIEIKCLKTRTSKERLNQSALSAISQIKEKSYQEELLREGIKNILLFGMSFYQNKAAIECEKIVN